MAAARSLAMTASIVAASMHRAIWPLTRSSVQWKTGRSARESLLIRNLASTFCRLR